MINYIAKYIHGSADSTDIDTYYVIDEVPEFSEAKKICDSIEGENANLIAIKNGVVVQCYKGTIDEVNNSLYETYDLHKQNYPLLVMHPVIRDKYLKYIRAIRGILSHLSRSQYRQEVKAALQGTWEQRLNTLQNIDLTTISFDGINKHISGLDTIKVIAFQIGQSLGLMEDVELYTKKDIAEKYSLLKSYLYREGKDLSDLNEMLHIFINKLFEMKYTDMKALQSVMFDGGYTYNLKLEKRVI